MSVGIACSPARREVAELLPVALLPLAFRVDEGVIDERDDLGGEERTQIGRVERLEFDLHEPSVAGDEPGRAGMGAVGTRVHIAITQAPRCAHCGRDDVEFVTFAPLDNDKRAFVVEPGPVCIDCAADMPRA